MTEQEIIQQAEEYAEKHYAIPFEDNSSMNVIVSEESYIAGAHSRDEEIAYLTYRLNDTAEKLQTVIAERDNLRNPWTSVKDSLPKEGQDVLICNWAGRILRNECVCKGDIKYMKNHPELYPSWVPVPKP